MESTSRKRGRKPGTVSDLQREQQAESRRRIVEATRQLLLRHSFEALSIDDVLVASGISRATFYRHFDSKLAVALALYEATMAAAVPHFEGLGSLRLGSRKAAITWIAQLVDIYRSNGPVSVLILQLGATDKFFHERLRSDRLALMRHLATNMPAFAATQGHTAAAVRAQVAADLMLMLLDRLCVEIAVHQGLPHEDSYISGMADHLMQFLHSAAPGR